jgi:predicted nucleotidyltransferase
MNRLDAIHQLANRAEALKARGATSLFMFGSTARGQSNASSDLDLFIEYDPKKKFSLVDLVGFKNFLEDELGVSVDVTTRDSLHPALREEIEYSAERVF